MKVMNAADARLKMAEVLNTAQHQGVVVELTRWGKPAACVVDTRLGDLIDQLGMDAAADVLEKAIEGVSAGVGESTGELDVVSTGEQPPAMSYFYIKVDGEVIPGEPQDETPTLNLDTLTDDQVDRAVA